jgi:hypothetical protein
MDDNEDILRRVVADPEFQAAMMDPYLIESRPSEGGEESVARSPDQVAGGRQRPTESNELALTRIHRSPCVIHDPGQQCRCPSERE